MPRKPRNLKTDIRSALRRVWLWSDLRDRAIQRARKGRGIYQCEACSGFMGATGYEVDHRIKATPSAGINGPEDWGKFIGNLLYCGDEGVVVLCKPCHAKKTGRERAETKREKTITKKKATKLRNKQPGRARPARHRGAKPRRKTGPVHKRGSCACRHGRD